MKQEAVKAGLPPIARPDARLFVLGSLPGDASLAARRYYAHPTNQFWKLLGMAVGVDLHAMEYEARLTCLADHRIGLWDVIASASRSGSLDQAIRGVAFNPLAELVTGYPELRAIAFNGSAAAALGRKLVAELPVRLDLVELPSSSAANTRPLATKAAAWCQLAQYVQP